MLTGNKRVGNRNREIIENYEKKEKAQSYM